MRIHIGADHAGLELKSALIEHLTAQAMKLKIMGHMNMTHLMIIQISAFRQLKL